MLKFEVTVFPGHGSSYVRVLHADSKQDVISLLTGLKANNEIAGWDDRTTNPVYS